MSGEQLNVRHVRDLLDYLEAEAVACIGESHQELDAPRDFVTTVKEFIKAYSIHLPLVAEPAPLTASRTRQIQEGFGRDWRTHLQAIRTIRPLVDLMLAVAEGQPGEEQARLHRAAFPRATQATDR